MTEYRRDPHPASKHEHPRRVLYSRSVQSTGVPVRSLLNCPGAGARTCVTADVTPSVPRIASSQRSVSSVRRVSPYRSVSVVCRSVSIERIVASVSGGVASASGSDRRDPKVTLSGVMSKSRRAAVGVSYERIRQRLGELWTPVCVGPERVAVRQRIEREMKREREFSSQPMFRVMPAGSVPTVGFERRPQEWRALGDAVDSVIGRVACVVIASRSIPGEADKRTN